MNMNRTEFIKYAKGRGISTLLLEDYTNSMTPYILEERQMNVTQMDVFSRLMKDRLVFIGTGINDQVANIIVAQLLFLESLDDKADIRMYINSPGGSVYDGLSIYDTMQVISPDVATVCTSMAASMGAILMVGGKKGKRSALKHSRIMIHQPSGGIQGKSSDIEVTAQEIVKIRKELYDILSERTGQPFDKIYKDCEKDYWMTATEAKEYGIIDEIVQYNQNKI